MRTINLTNVEQAHRMAIAGQKRQALGFCEAGMRIARLRHPDHLRALDKAAELLDSMAESQTGRMRRSTDSTRAEKAFPTEAALWREAYRMLDKGEPMQHFSWIYAAGAWLAELHEGIPV